MKREAQTIQNVRLGKLVHGGQAIAQIPDGKTVFVWGGLPDELVDVLVTKKKGSIFEAVVTMVHESSPDRVEPEEPLSYLSTSPWQIMSFKAENNAKQAILVEAFERESLKGIKWSNFIADKVEFGYRNKMEFGFWGDESGLHLAHYVRGSHGKQVVDGSMLTTDSINSAAQSVVHELRRLQVWGGDLKTVVLRSSQDDQTVAALFIKNEKLDFADFALPQGLKGLDIYYSDPKSPASVLTKKLYAFGDIKLTDTIMGKNITYDVMSFFQVNLPVFSLALQKIKQKLKGDTVVDYYSGVGTIGIPLDATTLVESDKSNIAMAKLNAKDTKTKVIHATSETALEYITGDTTLIVDPPRAGLHRNLIEYLAKVRPLQIIYLSCNPSTQARDVKLLEEYYTVTYAQGFNFFPRTPHIESLIVLELK